MAVQSHMNELPFEFSDEHYFADATSHKMALVRIYDTCKSEWTLSKDEAINTGQIYSDLTFSDFHVIIPISFTAIEKMTEFFQEKKRLSCTKVTWVIRAWDFVVWRQAGFLRRFDIGNSFRATISVQSKYLVKKRLLTI